MADKKGGGVLAPNVFNETSGGSGPEDADLSGGGIWGSWQDDVLRMHLSTDSASMVASPNIDDGLGIMGGPAPGEPNPAGFSGTSQSKGK